jgi:hypothetical protein
MQNNTKKKLFILWTRNEIAIYYGKYVQAGIICSNLVVATTDKQVLRRISAEN